MSTQTQSNHSHAGKGDPAGGSEWIMKEIQEIVSEKINLTMKEGSYESNFPAFLFQFLN